MSNVFYPLGLINNHKVTPVNSVVADKFESGATSTRLIWPAQNFKRQFTFQHNNLTLGEYRYLRSFYSQRNGMYDSFWYRDNVNRKGNALVRFSAPVVDQNDGLTFTVPVKLDEVAPIRTLPELDEITTAAGIAPILYYDGNRERYLRHAGTLITEPAIYDAANGNYPATWQSGSSLLLINSGLQQYTAYAFLGNIWAKSLVNVAELVGAQPACTIFIMAFADVPSRKNVLFSIGTATDTHGLGIKLEGDNSFQPWLGGTETWSNSKKPNPSALTLASYAVVWPQSSNAPSLYYNAALVGTGTESNTRSWIAGPVAIGGATDGTSTVESTQLSHALVFAGALTQAQIKAVHNLLGYQHGLAIVP